MGSVYVCGMCVGSGKFENVNAVNGADRREISICQVAV